jgi:hypothetical protein
MAMLLNSSILYVYNEVKSIYFNQTSTLYSVLLVIYRNLLKQLQDESYICCNAGKGLMPKKLRPAVDLMASKCRTLKVK